MKTTEALAAITAALFVANATASEEELLAALKRVYPTTEFTRIAKTPIPDLYEVWMGDNVAFVSNRNPRYFVFGRLFDTATLTDLTVQRHEATKRSSAGARTLSRLPIGDAITTVRGSGSRRIAVFSDPGCGYCKRLERELARVDDITIHTFLVPFQGSAVPLAIWCSADRTKAWRDYMSGKDRPLADAASCAHPLDRNLALARELDVRGTPTLVFADGSRIEGYADAAQIEARLAAAHSSTTPLESHQ